MFIILEKDPQQNTQNVLGLIYGDDYNLASQWTIDYISNDIKSRLYCPFEKYVKTIEYITNHNQNSFELIKRVTRVKRGYVYNTNEKESSLVYKIQILEFNNEITQTSTSHLYQNLNMQINKRVLQTLDAKSLIQVIDTLGEIIATREPEYTNILTDILKTFKKDFYSSIAKRLKRYGTKKLD